MITVVAIPDALCVLMCTVGAIIDVRQYRIPNWLTASGAVLGLGLNLATHMATAGIEYGFVSGAGAALVGGAVVLLVTAPLGALRLVGMGDVKLLIAAGLCVRWPLALHLLVYTVIVGGVVALVVAMARGVTGSVARNMVRRENDESTAKHRMPYGLAIAFGALWAVASRYQSWLRLLG